MNLFTVCFCQSVTWEKCHSDQINALHTGVHTGEHERNYKWDTTTRQHDIQPSWKYISGT